MSDGNQDAKLKRLKLRYPPMPQTLMEAMELMEHPEDLEVRPVTRMVQRDPFVVARLLHTVNSAYYGLRSTIKSAERAVVMLGPVAVAGIVVGMNMLKLRSLFDGPASNSFLRLIQHNIGTAFLTRHLMDHQSPGAGNTSNDQIGVSFTAGLLHDFGKLVLVYNYPDKAVRFYEERILNEHLNEDDARRLEQFMFGHDHAEAGEYVARKLSFPDELSNTIRFHHEPDEFSGDEEVQEMIHVVAGANRAAKALGYGFDKTLDWEDCAEDPIWEAPAFQRRFTSTDALLTSLVEQKPHLHDYVENLTALPDHLTD